MNIANRFPLIAKLTGESSVKDLKVLPVPGSKPPKAFFSSFSSGDMHQLQQETQQLKQLAGLEGEASLTSFSFGREQARKVLSGEVAQLSVSKVIAQIKTKGSGLLMNEAEMGFLDTVLKAVESKDPVALKALQEAAQQVGAGLVAENKGPEGKAPVVAPAPVAAQEKAPASSHLVIDKTDAHNQYAWRYLAERR